MRTRRPENNAGYTSLAVLLLSVCVFALPSHVEAKPPASPRFMRADDFQKSLEARLKKLQEQEAFEAKPRPERLVILLKRGTKKFGSEKLTGAGVVKEVFAWKELRAAAPGKPAERTAELLPEALHACFGSLNRKSKSAMRERYKTSRELVDALMDKHIRIRTIAIDCLSAIYGETRGYKPGASESERKRAQKKWAKAIRR